MQFYDTIYILKSGGVDISVQGKDSQWEYQCEIDTDCYCMKYSHKLNLCTVTHY